MSISRQDSGPIDTAAAQTILVIAAMRRETAVLRRRLDRRGRRHSTSRSWAAGARSWRLREVKARAAREVVVAHCGVGPDAVESWLDGRLWEQPPDQILVAGFAGGLDPDLRHGAVVWPREGAAVDPASGEMKSQWRLSRSLGRAKSGSLWSVERPILEPAGKRHLWQQTGRAPLALVDMESAALFAALVERGLPTSSLTACRVITDSATERLPQVIAQVRADGSIAGSRLGSALLRRPTTLVSLIRLALRARQGSRLLAEAVMEWLER